ncbi:fatty-acid-CoA ligase [Achlya hypogyna]|uniref:Fatty-acid-CoA ligase n=1 Tax=Achlya hypogyna TaxID=1202772 RepID=A0A1V9Z5V2_ACHHY|nr:fatty-acid-CoA ligase [Achlya hypogyna]
MSPHTIMLPPASPSNQRCQSILEGRTSCSPDCCAAGNYQSSLELSHTTTASAPRSSLSSTERTDATILDLLRRRAIQTPDRVCYIFLDDSGAEIRRLSYAQIDAEARRIATVLQQQTKTSFTAGDRVLLCFPPGADFILAFWGCLYAGAIVCAVYPPHPLYLHRDLPRFNRMVDETGARLVLTNSSYQLQRTLGSIKAQFGKHRRAVAWPAHVKWLSTDKATVDGFFNPTFYLQAQASDIAFLQFSSGATADPKPVVISHRNVFAQVQLWTFVQSAATMVSWLPPYHDNGLVGFNLAPIFTGATSIQLSPLGFIKNPTLWMQLCAKYKAKFTCAPNFAYLLAAKKTSASVAASLDLSHLEHATCGAEPIRGDYLKLFAKTFAPAGFRPEFFHCTSHLSPMRPQLNQSLTFHVGAYGGAEPTLVACAYKGPRTAPRSLLVDKAVLESHGRVQLLAKDDPRRAAGTGTLLFVACGEPAPGYDLRIVDPKSHRALPEGYTGEIWLHGDSIAEGYWQRWDLTRRQFHATLADDATRKHYWRSSDLGFMHRGELFYYARLQDVVNVPGRSICPQTIECSVEAASPLVRAGCVAVFAENGAVVVVAELKDDLTVAKDGDATKVSVCKQILERVAADQQLVCAKIVLIQPRTIPKTTSGKLQRGRARDMFETDALSTQHVYTHES